MTSTGNVNFGQMAAVSKNGFFQGAAGTKSIEKASETFSTVMNQSMDQAQAASDDLNQEKSAADAVEHDVADMDAAYDRYRYKEHSIEETSDDKVNETISSGEEDLENFEKEVVKAVSEELGVTENDVTEAMEMLHLMAFDLIDSEKLGMLAAELSGITDSMQLLLDNSFSELKNQIGNLANELMQNLDVSLKEFQEIIERLQMPKTVEQPANPENVVNDLEVATENPEIMPEDHKQAAAELETPQTEAKTMAAADVPEEGAENAVLKGIQTETVQTEAVRTETSAAGTVQEVRESPEMMKAPQEEMPQEEMALLKDPKEETEVPLSMEEVPEEADGMPKLQQTPNAGGKKSAMQNQQMPMNENAHPAQQPVTAENVLETPQTERNYSFKAETLEIIQKVVQTIKVAVSTEQTTMEMQLNPENLGKLYLEITAREGAVRAQIAAQNEAVQQALEAQIATLRESLEQAGVRVDAIEVTVASHEFEKNLEQNEHREEEAESKRQESMKSGRRNLRLDDLDELSGIMTEEELLVAQMMKDNGNSVDLSA